MRMMLLAATGVLALAGAGGWWLSASAQAPSAAPTGAPAQATPATKAVPAAPVLPKAEGLVPLTLHPAGVPWPTRDWAPGRLPGERQARLDGALNALVGGQVDGTGETRAVVIIHGGRIVGERYGEGYDRINRLISWSMAKSVTAALTGIAVKDGLLTLDSPLDLSQWVGDERRQAIRLRHALAMTDGLDFNENNYGDVLTNDAALMLFGPGRENIVAYAASKSMKHEPGTVWNYSSGTTNLIAATISRKLGPPLLSDRNGAEAFRNFMVDRLFRPIGMTTASPEFDAAGNFYGSSLLHATARDWAKFGYLHLRDGVWDGQRILPEGWVDYVRSPTVADGVTNYGAHWWLSPRDGSGTLKTSGFDSFEASGFQGQIVMIIPSKDAVIVRLGRTEDSGGLKALDDWLQQVVDILPDREG